MGEFRPGHTYTASPRPDRLEADRPEDTPPVPAPANPGEVIRREWRPGGGGRIEPTNAKLKKRFVAATDGLRDIRAPQGKAGFTNIELDGVRIDTQSFANDGTCYNVQCQVGRQSMAGVIFPIGLDIDEVKRGLLLAIAANAMYTWYPDEADGGAKTDGGKQDNNRRNNRKPPKGGGGGGGKGNNFAAATSSAIRHSDTRRWKRRRRSPAPGAQRSQMVPCGWGATAWIAGSTTFLTRRSTPW